MSNWKHALYELTRSESALKAVKKISLFEDEFIIPLVNGAFSHDDLCKAVKFWKENEWLQQWLNKYVNTRPDYTLYIGSAGGLEEDELPSLGETTPIPIHSSDEDACAIRWHANKDIAKREAMWHMRDEQKDEFGYIVSAVPSEQSLILDYRHFYGVLRKWYSKNKDIKERWDYKLDENVLQNLYNKAKSYFDKNKGAIAGDNKDTKTTNLHIPGKRPASANYEWDYKNIGQSLGLLAEEGNDVLVLREMDQATCIARWVNADGKVMKDGEW